MPIDRKALRRLVSPFAVWKAPQNWGISPQTGRKDSYSENNPVHLYSPSYKKSLK